MKNLLAACAALVAALAVAGTAGAGPLKIGAADDTGKYADDCGASFFGQMNEIGYTVNRVTVLWDETRPGDIVEQGFLDRSVPCAQARGIRLVFSIFPLRPTAISADPINRTAQFTSWLQKVAQRYPSVTNMIVGNEPNVNRFWQPVSSGPSQFEALLAQSYDALKAVNPNINVIGVGLSPRGNDNPTAASNPSLSPVNFIAQFAKAYRDSGRTQPLMDEFSYHPYANLNNEPYSKGYQWPNAGLVNFDRIKQAFWDGFHGTGQKVFAEQAGGRETQAAAADAGCDNPVSSQTLCSNYDEVGTQTQQGGHGGYTGAESPSLVPQLVDEATQSRFYVEALNLAACDPAIESLLFFDFVDETQLDRFQSGQIFADGARKQAFGDIKSWIGSNGGRCNGQSVGWRHATGVVGANALFRDTANKPRTQKYWSFGATATEDATYKADIVNTKTKKSVMSTSGQIQAYFTPLVKFPGKVLPAGCYRYELDMTADMNPDRDSTFASKEFKVGTGCAAGTSKPPKPPKAPKPPKNKKK